MQDILSMKNDDYLLEYQDHRNTSIELFLEHLKEIGGKPLRDLRIRDLSYFNNREIFPGQGVYFFRKGDEVVYIGKVSSMSFTERVPKHFDLRRWAWFNVLLKLIAKHEQGCNEGGSDRFGLASRYAFENLNLVLLNMHDRDSIDNIERLFLSCTAPLNRPRNPLPYDLKNEISFYETLMV